ncbi:hypothetical protein ACHAWC_004696 [Mediolabrus comicus]
MQLATQDDNVDFGGGGYDDYGDNNDDDDDGMGISAKSSYKSKSSQSQGSTAADDDEEEEEEPPKKQRGRPKKEKKDDNAPPVTPTSVLRTKKSKKSKKNAPKVVKWSTPNGHEGVPAGNREYETVPVSDYKDSPSADPTSRTPGGSSLRRSRRARFEPIQWWKNERLVYGPQNEEGELGEAMGDMPVVTGVNKALPTPYKEVKRERKAPVATAGEGKRGGKRKGGGDDVAVMRVEDMPQFDDKAFRKKYKKTFNDGETGSVWSETFEETTDTKIVSRLSNRNFSQLPLSKSRKKGESKKVGQASQAFHVQTDDDDLFPGYIAGNVILPPKAIKDAEGVGLCSQVFNVGDCQPNSLEFALADPSSQDGEFDEKTAQRFLLSKGDMFQIPPGNVYRIENHSKTEDAKLFWTIIKCTSRAEQDDSDSD